jgi:hypothetical protein
MSRWLRLRIGPQRLRRAEIAGPPHDSAQSPGDSRCGPNNPASAAEDAGFRGSGFGRNRHRGPSRRPQPRSRCRHYPSSGCCPQGPSPALQGRARRRRHAPRPKVSDPSRPECQCRLRFREHHSQRSALPALSCRALVPVREALRLRRCLVRWKTGRARGPGCRSPCRRDHGGAFFQFRSA